MGVKGLNGYINNNILPNSNKWILDKKIYGKLSSKQPVKINNKNGLNLIIDASAYFYYLLEKINWFVFDNLELLNLLEGQLHYFLSIQNLQKIFFVFDGVNSPLKAQTENERRNNRILSINEFFNQVTSYAMPDQKNIPKTLSPTPLVHMTYMQFLNDASKMHQNIEIKYFPSEADSYISNLANKYNGYVISKDSDFFIYKTPGYINIDSLEFPNDLYDFNHNFSIKYKLYTRSMILNHFSLTDDTLPIFATLCSNDYLKIDNYPQLKSFFKYYNRSRSSRYSTNSISYFIYKNIVNFILDMKDRAAYNYYNGQPEGITRLQNSIIEKICSNRPLEINSECNNKFKSTLIESVRQYNNENDNDNDDSSISTDILNSYKFGNFYYRLLNVPIKKQFVCSYYFEDIRKESCRDITKNMRKKMYGLIISRNLKFPYQYSIKKSETIEEIGRTNSSVDSKEVSISPSYQYVFDYPNNDMFIYYLTLFKSNKNEVKALPYYLIPVVASLRYLLKKKVKENLFKNENSDQIYTSNMASTSTKLYYYELKALLASSIAALTMTYLNISSPYLDESQRLLDSLLSLSLNSSSNANNLTLEENIQKHDQMVNDSNNYNNLYNNMKPRGKRSLKLKDYEEIKKLQKNSNQFKNAIHIYAEFNNILIMNSYMLQVLKLTEKFPSLSFFYSMYPYLWEGAYYSMIESFKCNNKKVSSIFRSLFNIEFNANSDNYVNELEKIYSKMLNAILA